MPPLRSVPLIAVLCALVACSGSAEPELAIMGDGRDQLPAWVGDAAGLPVEDLTRVADVDGLHVFASRDGDSNWCVVLVIEPTSQGSDWGAASSCTPGQQFAEEGARVEATAPSGRSGGALLLPDGYSGDIEEGWERVNDNLAIRQ